MPINIGRLTVVSFFSLATLSGFAKDQVVEFDIGTLEARGLSKNVAEYFKTGKRFSPGVHRVALMVNGVAVGFAHLSFDAAGEPCYDLAFFEKARIKIPAGALGNGPQSCIADLKTIYPQATASLYPGQQRIEMLVPTSGLSGHLAHNDDFYRGGTAGVFNYDVLGLVNDGQTRGNSVVQGSTETGVNIGDWIVRSRQTFIAQSDAQNSVQPLYVYAQRSFDNNHQVFQTGELYASNTLFSLPQILGAQVFPDSALRAKNQGPGVMVDGIAPSEARIEVRQAGVLIYSTLVPAGPFALSSLPLVTSGADLHVTVIELNGASQSFVVPYGSLAGRFVPQERGWSAAAGKIRAQDGSDLQTENLATLNGITPVGNVLNVSGGVVVSERFRSLGLGLDGMLPLQTSASGKLLTSGDSRSGTNGVQLSSSLSVPLAPRLSLTMSQLQQTSGYRDLGSVPSKQSVASAPDALLLSDSRYNSQYSLGLGYSDAALGGVRLGYSHSSSYSAANTQRYIGSWSKAFDNRLMVSATLERHEGSRRDAIAYVSLSMPLGSVRVGSTLQRTNGVTTLGSTVDQQVNDYVGYHLSANKALGEQSSALNGTVRLLPKYTSVSLGAATYGGGRSYSGTTRGGMVLHSDGLTFSPYPVQDTFALLDVSGLSGLRISTPQGPVWSDWKGSAVAAYMPPYYESKLELSTRDLPRNVDVDNGVRVSTPARGSVSQQRFAVVTTRRVLLRVRDAAGRYVGKGVGVINAQGEYVATVGAEGAVFISDESQLRLGLYIQNKPNERCQLHFDLPKKAPENELYEELDSVCQQTIVEPFLSISQAAETQ